MSKTAKLSYLIKNLNRLAPGVLKNEAVKYLFENSLKFWGPSKEFFSQFGEDAFLQCYFANKAWKPYNSNSDMETGFYIDVGAFSPISISNSYSFYKKGWRGINIDVTPEVKELFDIFRPRDLNIHAAISDEEKELLSIVGGFLFIIHCRK